MAKERVIRISTELDTSGMLSGINQMRQMLGNINVDSNLFKDVNKDLDKITKDILEVKNSLKNGIPEKGVTSFLNKIENINKVYSALPDKIKQVQINTQNIRFSNQTIQQLETLDQQIIKLGEDAKKAIGEDLKTSLRNAVPKNIISDATLKTLTEATDKTKAFSDYFDQMADNAEAAKTKVANSIKDIANTIVKNTDANAAQKRAAFSQFGTAAMNALQGGAIVNINAKDMAQNAANIGATKKQYEALQKAIIDYQAALQSSNNVLAQRQAILDIISKAESDATQMATQAANLTIQREQAVTNAIRNEQQAQQQAGQAAETHGKKAITALNQVSDGAQKANTHLQRQDSLLKQLAGRAASLIGIGAVFNYITRGIRDAWNSIKELDKEFTAIAVVTDKTTSQLWQSFSTYAQMAQGLGVATKDAVATSALYYQQGLKTADVMTLTAETIKMAQIAGMDFKTATDQMTAALRGYNLEMSQANMVNDIFSTLAANAAVDTKELSYALTKTASIAESAGMSIDTTSAFLAKMIETTREAPENIGTAMKSIVARFEELKKNPLALSVDVEGEEVVANKVEAAIALAGVRLRDETTGQFRNLDDVFLELAKSWDSLDRNTQRYIATIAAGSRQQSRFIALMDGYDRTLELVELAQDSEGQSAAQFLKTLDSLDSKINKITNSLESLYQKFVNSDFFGGLLDGLNDLLQDFGDWDAGILAAFATAGVVLGNNLVNGIRRSIAQAPSIINGLATVNTNRKTLAETDNKINKIEQSRNFASTAFGNYIQSMPHNPKPETKTVREKILPDLIKLQNLNKEIDTLKQKINSTTNTNLINTTADLEELTLLEEKAAALKDNLDSEITQNLGKKATKTDSILNSQSFKDLFEELSEELDEKGINIDDLDDEVLEKLKEQKGEIEGVLKENAEELKVDAGSTMMQTGTALVSSLTLGISMALEQENPLAAIGTSVSTFFLQMLPTLIQQGTAVAAAGVKSFKDVVTAAGGWVTLVIEGAALLIAALAPLIANLVKNAKSESEKLQDELDKLQDAQKQLQENSERLTAEAAVEKTKYKNIQKLTKNYDELINKTGRTTEENEKLNKTIEDLATDFPDLVDYYDEAGNAVLKQRKEWETIVDLQKQSAQEAAQSALGAKIATDLNQLQISKLNTQLAGARAQEKISQNYTWQKSGVNGDDYSKAFSQYGPVLGGMALQGTAMYNGIRYLSDAWINLQKTSQIQDISNIDFNNQNEVKNLRQRLANIEAENIGYLTDSDSYKELLALPSTQLLKTTEDLKKWANSLSSDNTLKAQLLEDIGKNPQTVLAHYQNIFKQIDDQINALNTDYISEETKKAIEQTKKDLQNYFISYIQTFKPEETEGYTEKGLQFFGQVYGSQQSKNVNQTFGSYMASKKGDLIGHNNTASKIIEELYLEQTGNVALDKELKDVIDTLPTTLDWTSFDKREDFTLPQINAMAQILGELQSIDQQNNAEDFAKMLPQIKDLADKGILDQQVLDVINSGDWGAYGTIMLQSLVQGIHEAMGEEGSGFANAFDEMVSKQTDQLKQMQPAFAEIGRQYGTSFSQALIDAGTSPEQAGKLVNSLKNNLDVSQMSSIFSMITADSFDWGSIDQLKKLSVQFMDMGMSTEEATDTVWELRNALTDPINLTINADKAIEDVTKVANSLTDLKKGLKDLNAAVQEYNENGRLSGETILDLVANGQLMYLSYDEQTKAITINKNAMVDYYNAQVAQAKLEIQLKKQEAERSVAALKVRQKSLELQRNLLKTALENEGKLTEEQYKALTTLNNTYDEVTLTDTSNFLGDLIDSYAEALKEMRDLAAQGGVAIHDAFMSGITGGSENVTIPSIDSNKAALNDILNNAKKRYLPSNVPDSKYVYQLDPKAAAAQLELVEKELAGSEKIIAEQEKLVGLYSEGENILDNITGSGLDSFMNDTAKAASEANKELKEYVSTLEKYYNLLKDTEHAEEDYERAKKEYERNPTTENYQKMQQTRVDYGKQLLTQKATFEKERDEDVQRGEQSFVKFGLTPQDAKQIAELTSRKDVNQDELRNWLKDQGYDQDTAEKFEKLWEDYKKEIETDNSNIKAADDKLYEIQVDQENDLKKIEEDLRNFDRLKNIEQALSRLDKLMQDAERDLQDYYESGGKEGMDLQQYLHTQGAGIQELNLAASEISKVKSDIVAENKQLLDNYAIEVDGEWYLNPDTVGDLDPNGETYKALEGIFNQLNKIKDKEDEITDKQRDYAKAAKEALRAARKSYSDLVMKAADALAQLDQKAIDEVKKKYTMIQEEDEKYLNSLQKSIDKQRQLRDQANSYDDLEKQEKRLALLERDTSGANAAEIAALKEQIKDARQSLVDTEQDNIVNNISEANDLRKEKMDEETTFLQNVMDERTYDMQYYIERAQDIVNAAIDGDEGAYKRLLEILQETDEAYYKGTKQMQEEWMEGWETNMTTATGYVTALKNGTVKILGETTEEIIKSLSTFAEQNIGKVSEVETKVNELAKVTKEIDMTECFDKMKEAVKEAYDQLSDLINDFNDKTIHTQVEINYKATGDVPGNLYPDTSTGNSEKHTLTMTPDTATLERFRNEWENTHPEWYASSTNKSNNNNNRLTMTPDSAALEENKSNWIDEHPQWYASSQLPENSNIRTPVSTVDELDKNYYAVKQIGGELHIVNEDDKQETLENWKEAYNKAYSNNYLVLSKSQLITALSHHNRIFKRYKEGGLVKYTGPAWVDGTPSTPEAFLSADDTRNFQELAKVLQSVLNLNGSSVPTTEKDKTQIKSGDTNIEIHLEIGEISDDYDIDRMLDQIQERISEASEGQVTIVR